MFKWVSVCLSHETRSGQRQAWWPKCAATASSRKIGSPDEIAFWRFLLSKYRHLDLVASKTLSSIKKNVSSENTTVYVDVWIKRTEKWKVGFDFPETRQIFTTCKGWKFSKRNLTNRLIWPMILTNLRTRRTMKKSNAPWLDCTIKREITNIYQWRIQERDPEDPSPPLFNFRPKWGPKDRKKIFGDRPPPPTLIPESGWPGPTPLIWRSGSATVHSRRSLRGTQLEMVQVIVLY